MDKKIAGLLGAAAGFATIASAQAAIDPAAVAHASRAASYADLLKPIANPIDLLQADDAARARRPEAEPAADFQLAAADHHHHHSYSRTYRYNRRYSRNYHHHHHHHHHGVVVGVPGVGGVIVNGR